MTAVQAGNRAERLRDVEQQEDDDRVRVEGMAMRMLVGPGKGQSGNGGKGRLLDPERLLAVQSHVVSGYVGE